MSTRSAIIMKDKDGYTGIYCHFDGYLEGVGAILKEHYTNPAKVEKLIALGDLSVLGERAIPTPGSGHTFDKKEAGVTTAYYRDRGEDFSQAKGKTVKEVAKQIDNNGFVYVFEDGKWTCNGENF